MWRGEVSILRPSAYGAAALPLCYLTILVCDILFYINHKYCEHIWSKRLRYSKIINLFNLFIFLTKC